MRKRWHWYIARENELLVDCDRGEGQVAGVLSRLGRAVRKGFLKLASDAFVEPSNSAGKFHVVIILQSAMPERERVIWQWWLGSDKTREIYNLMRIEKGVSSPNLLIRRKTIHGFRKPDYVCFCNGKHKGLKRCRKCPVMRRIHGKAAGKAYFPLAPVVKIKQGRVSVRWLKSRIR